jgi:hypothetical protein
MPPIFPRAGAQGGEELQELIGIHAAAVVADRAAVDTPLGDGLPLDAELDLGGVGLEGVLEELSGPLVAAAGLEHPVDEVGRA